ncbi:MAG: DUF192 domain-containing protein [Candidatus Omnitrophica bacterium]|nr:DUF192 domain-containing protein [Candidatus Omnitrophota bacterium]
MNMRRQFSILLGVWCLGIAACVPPQEQRVRIGDAVFVVQTAASPRARRTGLMGRRSLDDNEGMLFVFERSGRYPFWMKNMKIPLDILWIDAQFRIVHIEPSVPPCTMEPCPGYHPALAARYVLELPAGSVVRHRIGRGDTVEFLEKRDPPKTVFPRGSAGVIL